MRLRVDVSLSFRPGEQDQRFVVTVDDEDEPDEPTVELELAMEDEQMTCTAVTVRKKRGVVSRDVRVPVDRYLVLVAEHPALRFRGGARTRPRHRRVITDDFLRDVVDAYAEGGRPAVQDRFPASDSQVFRWLKAARERGLLHDKAGE